MQSNGCETMDAKVDVKLTIMKPLHAKWFSKFYNCINSSEGQEITGNGSLRAGIIHAIKMGSSKYFHWIIFSTYAAISIL